ncbi:UDP-glucose 4-epimerase family protein [Dissulfurispira sp.]|uniref:UDP-glucose 4-epimerase family protein n=1 Tax=Dissulfurispira sp. TaxID=2817609 RepID=UPI002FDA25EF
MRILITGANGFVGRALCERLIADGWQVRGAVRSLESTVSLPDDVEPVIIGPIGPDTNWIDALKGIDAIVHLAARVHVMGKTVSEPLAAFHQVNTQGTEHLARMVAGARVKRFVYISSIKVNGENTDTPCTEQDKPSPDGPYAISKLEAEQALRKIASDTELEIVIIRPPLVYGPGARGNFDRLVRLVKSGAPLPLGSIKNQRSFIYIGNLVDAIVKCIDHPNAANQTFLVSDGQDVSTPDLIRMIAEAMGKRARLFPCPVSFLKMIGKITGKSGEIERLAGSLIIDSSKIRKELNWNPPFTVDEGLRHTAEWFRAHEAGI